MDLSPQQLKKLEAMKTAAPQPKEPDPEPGFQPAFVSRFGNRHERRRRKAWLQNARKKIIRREKQDAKEASLHPANDQSA